MKLGNGHAAAAMLVSLMLSGCAGGEPQRPIYFSAGGNLPFSEAVQVGDLLFVSGQIGVAPGTTVLAPGGMQAEARQAMQNIGAVLSRRRLSFENVVKCTVMLADMSDWPAFNAVYATYFKPGRLPARSAFAVKELANGGRLEVECWAHTPLAAGIRP